MLLMIDNYDSFTFNLVQYFGELGQDVKVVRNDALSVDEIAALGAERIVISPGPCTPDQAGVSLEVLDKLSGKLPILGVCLGHQSLGQAFGGKVIRAKSIMHGKTSPIHHTGVGVFAGLPSPFQATRYHSLVVEKESLPDCLEITAWTENEDGIFDEMVDLMRQVMRGEVSPVMTAALLTGLRVKKETIGEIAAAASVMRELAARVEVPDNSHFVDIVGT